jgi:hypothetical protein
MFRRSLLPILLFVLAFCFTACDPPSNEVIATVIQSASAVAFDRIINSNPELEDTFYAFAVLNKQIMVDRTVNAELAKRLMTDVLANFEDLDEDAQMIIVTLFNTVLPLIELPDEGVIKEPQKMFLIAFYDGIIQAVDMKRAIRDSVVPPISWEVWLYVETLNSMG